MDGSSRITGTPDRYRCGSAAEIEEAAAKWLIEIDREATLERAVALDAWLVSNPRRRAAFLRLSIAWLRMDRLRKLRL